MSDPESLGSPTVSSPAAKTPAIGAGAPSVRETNEVFLGGMVVVVLCLLLLILTATFGYFGYRLWQSSRLEENTPSIQELGEKPGEVAPSPVSPTVSEPAPTTPTPETTAPDFTKVSIKVFNGGAAKGSAGTAADLLRKQGFTKTEVGNTTTDYTGATVYYQAGQEGVAEKVRSLLVATFSKIITKAAPATDKEAGAAPVTVILGR